MERGFGEQIQLGVLTYGPSVQGLGPKLVLQESLQAGASFKSGMREGMVNGQSSVLVGYRSSAERRWIEAYRQTALGSVVCRRYFGYGVDNCRNVSSVGQPETISLTQVS